MEGTCVVIPEGFGKNQSKWRKPCLTAAQGVKNKFSFFVLAF
jgi:hypothetical protein